MLSTELHYADMRELERSIALAYVQASERLFELFFVRFRLLEHLRALKDFVMLGKGDFVEILMEQLGCVLCGSSMGLPSADSSMPP